MAPTGRTSPDGTRRPDDVADQRRWLALGVIAVAQLMIVLDAAIVFIALPSAQSDLGISTANRQWVVTAYTVAFGGLLLLGGRVADLVGRKRTLVMGLIGFAVASALGGSAPNSALLFAARALQGAFAALLAPSVLSLISVTFTEKVDRARAFGVYSAVSGSGAAVGLVLGGVLTQYASWRWCMLVNVPLALATCLAAVVVVRDDRPADRPVRYDVPGAVTVTAGLVALVYGFTVAAEHGWGSARTIGTLALAVVLLAGFLAVEARSGVPLMPLEVPGDRNRGSLYLAALLVNAAQLSMFLFLTFYFQSGRQYGALRTGFAFLPFALGVIAAARLGSRLLPATGPKPLILVGNALGVAGLLMLTRIDPDTAYATYLLPAEIVMGVGVALSLMPLNSTVLVRVAPRHAGVASALVSTTQQAGGALGSALLNTVYATTAAGYLARHPGGTRTAAAATIHGDAVAFAGGAVMFAAAFVVVLALVRLPPDSPGASRWQRFGRRRAERATTP